MPTELATLKGIAIFGSFADAIAFMNLNRHSRISAISLGFGNERYLVLTFNH